MYKWTSEQEAVFDKLRDHISEIIGSDVAEIIGIEPDSQFVKDLEMDSIQIVAFAERVIDDYGDRFDFMGWLTSRPLRQLLKLRVCDVVDQIVPEVA
jgi:acyl carrier protein